MKYSSAKNPAFNEDGSVSLIVTFDEIGESGFTASPNDCEEHGRELYMLAMAGEFGPIAPFVPTQKPTVDPVEKLRAFLEANPDVAELI